MAAATTASSAMEGVEAAAGAVPQPADAGHRPAEGVRVGQQQQGLLAHGRLASAGPPPADRVLGNPWLDWLQPSLASAADDPMDGRIRARMPAGVGGDGYTPPADRSA